MPAFKPFDDAKPAKIEPGDTLDTIAERERSGGNEISSDNIALFNWGTTEPGHIQELMRDELGARGRLSPMDFVLDPEDEARTPLRVPELYDQDGFSTAETHKITVRTKTCGDQFIDCCSLPAITFPYDSSFIRPDVADSLGAVEALIHKQPDSKLMVFGHTDAVGSEGYNKRLSERRAWSVYAFILNDINAWETLYNHPDEEWGVAVIQEILTDLGHDPGGIDGDMGPATKAQMCAFLGLPEDAPVHNDAAFRAQLFAAYMGGKHDIEIEADRFLDPAHMGCGEFNLLQDEEAANPRNRRVTIYAFHKERPPNLPCRYDDTAPCKKQVLDTEHRHQTGFACSFYDSLAGHCPGEGLRHLNVYLLDYDGHAIPQCPFRAHVNGTVIIEGHADAEGLIELPDSVPHIVQIDWDRPKDEDAEPDVYRFSRQYIVSVSSAQTKSGVAVRLENLGFQDEEFDEQWADFSTWFDAHITSEFDEFAAAIDQWHKTGDPSHFLSGDDDGDEEPGEDPEELDDADWWENEGGDEYHDEDEVLYPPEEDEEQEVEGFQDEETEGADLIN